MPEQFLDTGDVTLCFEVLGDEVLVDDPDAPTVVLVMGLGLDMLWWRSEFCADLVGRGIRVIRFDNRDVGRSTRLSGPVPGAFAYLTRRASVTYTIEDMAEDTGALIAAVAPGGAHVVGVSLGSMIAQATAVRHPDRVRSLTSIMGRPGGRAFGEDEQATGTGFVTAGARRSGREHGARLRQDRFPAAGPPPMTRTSVRFSPVPRCVPGWTLATPVTTGPAASSPAILREHDRTAGLRGYPRPALVIHGDRDRVIRPSGGRATAAALPDAELLVLPGMGHDLARRLWPDVLDGIERTVRRAEANAAGS